ncbi:hypothetical protein [Pararhizobium gei]|uniref:hypothetical protein n=1 Tax=Pararhizobium gei TaxID=1395951 RepID=UPI0023DA223C|nr:hypothetical protein [Rhizobium gei]
MAKNLAFGDDGRTAIPADCAVNWIAEMKMMWSRKTSEKAGNSEPEQGGMVRELAHPPTTSIEDYLSYYIGLDAPGYAVLVTGDWGSGKTFQVRRVLPDTHAYYVSLFGLNSAEEVETLVFSKMFPKASAVKKIADKVGTLNVAAPNVGTLGIAGLATLITNSFIKEEVDTSKPIVFDDLERSPVDKARLLGVINRYVEHHGCRVIVIAHDDKLVGEFNDAKEKVFGQTLRVKPDVAAAFSRFLAEFSAARGTKFIDDLNGDIFAVFEQSGAKSLRLLRHLVEDTGRLIFSLEDRHREHIAATTEIVRLFAALALEVRMNRLQKEDLVNRELAIYSHGYVLPGQDPATRVTPPIVLSNDRYSLVKLTSTVLEDSVLQDMLFAGRYDQADIRASVDRSRYFFTGTSEPWQRVINFGFAEDDVVDEALHQMNEQFDRRQVIDSGDMLHIFALRLMMAENGVVGISIEDTVSECKAYIDDLLAAGRLPPRTRGPRWFDDFRSAYRGIGYWVTNERRADFSEIFNHLLQSRVRASEISFPDIVPDLLETVRTNGLTFFERVCHTNHAQLEFDDIPVLAAIPPEEFVTAFVASPKAGWHWICSALKERNRAIAHYPSLHAEGDWLIRVIDLLAVEATGMRGLARVRLLRAIAEIGVPRSVELDAEDAG